MVTASEVGIRTSADWPYGADTPTERRLLVEWATHRGLRLSMKGHNLAWLFGKKTYGYEEGHHWLDHVTCWNRDGKPAVLVAQPYGLSGSSIRQLAQLDEHPELCVAVDGTGWYGHRTTFVEVWRLEAHQALAEQP